MADQSMPDLQSVLGQMDIYLLDQVLKRRIVPGDTIFDAGCGYGRNISYFLKEGYEVHAVDADEDAMSEVRRMAAALAPSLPSKNFQVASLEELFFPIHEVDVVVSSAVLHFAHDDQQFDAMLAGSWRPLRSGGIFFARLASSIGMSGMEDRVVQVDRHRYRLPDGTLRFLVDEARLLKLTKVLGGQLLDPLKTTVVQNQRCMTTWVVRKD